MPSLAATIRPACKSDAAALAALIDIAGDGLPVFLWDMMKAPDQSVFEFGRGRAARDQGNFSYRNATVAEVGGEVAAGLVDYQLDDPYDSGDIAELPEAVRPLVTLESQAPGSWYINVLAAFPEYRGHGLGAQLLTAAEDHGRARQVRSASMIVASENIRAARLYARSGYRDIARAPVNRFRGCAHGGDWVLMVKPI
jgi:ribosomal protein S18 acetylase RimI-like enzyme